MFIGEFLSRFCQYGNAFSESNLVGCKLGNCKQKVIFHFFRDKSAEVKILGQVNI